MKIEFNPDPNTIRWVVLVFLIVCGVNYDKLLLLGGV